MIWKIAKKEFLLNLMTFKFAVGAVACIALFGLYGDFDNVLFCRNFHPLCTLRRAVRKERVCLSQ